MYFPRLKTVFTLLSEGYFCPANQFSNANAHIMKQVLLLSSAVLAISLTACNRHEAPVQPGNSSVSTYVTTPTGGGSNAMGRLTGQYYSSSISIDTANKMIGSYLQSVGYPQRDTTIRALSFDADTIRNYLANNDIKTLKFFLGHQLSYLNGGTNRFGKNIGMAPGKLTIIMAGMDDDGNIVHNWNNGVYEHAFPCPNACGGSGYSAFLD
jgi:hypothetical protein